MKHFVRGTVAAIAMGASALSASAADLATKKAPPVIEDDFHPFQVRALVSSVVPLAGTAQIWDRGNGSYMPGLAGYNGQGAGPANQTVLQALGYSLGAGSQFNGAGTTISWAVMPTVSLGYYLNKNWSVEAICCVTPHHVQGTGSINGGSVIKTWVFPPTLTLVYHFTNFGAFQPYIGAGVNFTAYWGTRAGNQPFQLATPIPTSYAPALIATYTATGATITPSWGVAAQAGMDYMINKEWGWNLDAKWIMMQPNAHVYGTANTNAGQVLGAPQYNALSVPLNLAVKINPIVVSTGLTYRFGSGKSQAALIQSAASYLPFQ